MSQFLRGFVVLAILGSSVASAWGGGPGGRGHGMGRDGGGTCLAAANLTPEQREKIAAIHKEFDPLREKARSEMQALRTQLRDLRLSQASAAQITEVEGKLTALRAQHLKIRDEVHGKVTAVLSPEQAATCTDRHGMGMGRGW